MSVNHALVAVDTTAVDLTAGVSNANRWPTRSVVLTNVGTASIYIGGSNVTTSSYGYELKAGAELALDLYTGDAPFAIGAAAGGQVRVLHTGV